MGSSKAQRWGRGIPTIEDQSARLVPSAEFVEEVERKVLHAYEGVEAQTLADYVTLHRGVIELLREAEDYLCPNRVSAIIDVLETLDQKALPEEFFRRVLVVQKRIARLGRKRPRTLERDQNIRREWRILRGQSAHRQYLARRGYVKESYSKALEIIAEGFSRSKKAIEAAIGRDDNQQISRAGGHDFTRLQAAIQERFPRK